MNKMVSHSGRYLKCRIAEYYDWLEMLAGQQLPIPHPRRRLERLVYHLPSRNATFVVVANGMRGSKHSAPREEIFKGIVELLIPEAGAW